MKIFTIGFTKTTAEGFFERLKDSGAKKILDVRLNGNSQLSGFAKKKDLPFFLENLCGMEYQYLPDLTPTQSILDAYKKKKGSWEDYEDSFLNLMRERKIEDMDPKVIDGGCLLCSEDKPHHCHRRLVAEYLQEKWGDIEIQHL